MCAWCPQSQKRASDSMEQELEINEAPHGCWEPRPRPMEVQLVLLTAELSPGPIMKWLFFYREIKENPMKTYFLIARLTKIRES